MTRFPSTEDAIEFLRSKGIEFDSLVDVGVHTGTPKLMKCLPNARHILVEPSPAHRSAIEANYADFDFELHAVAAGSKNVDAFVVDLVADAGTAVTHSKMVETREEAEAIPGAVAIHDLPIRTLDSITNNPEGLGSFLLKIDVDGHEPDVIEGATETLSKAAAVLIEAPLSSVSERTALLEARGFVLYEIVDLEYYKGALWQVDLLFLAANLIEKDPNLRPKPGQEETPFDPSEYVSLRMPGVERFQKSLRRRLTSR